MNRSWTGVNVVSGISVNTEITDKTDPVNSPWVRSPLPEPEPAGPAAASEIVIPGATMKANAFYPCLTPDSRRVSRLRAAPGGSPGSAQGAPDPHSTVQARQRPPHRYVGRPLRANLRDFGHLQR